MTTTQLFSSLLGEINTSLESTLKVAENISTISGSEGGGISLLDTKNELLLSYVQNLVFLVLLKIRDAKRSAGYENDESHEEKEESNGLNMSAVVEKLVELRLYLEKGVRPLEEKLRFQIEKALQAATDAERINVKTGKKSKTKKPLNSDSELDSVSSDQDSDSGSDSSSSEQSVNEKARGRANARPTLSKMNVPRSKTTANKSSTATEPSSSLPYRPPKNRPVVMPDQKERDRRGNIGPLRSRTLDEFVDTELLAQPAEMPSIGTTILGRGRMTQTAMQRREADERREYEEANFVRLPKLTKAEQSRRNRAEARHAAMRFGGEEWLDLDRGVQRIEALTRRKEPSGVRGTLERSRKRQRPDATDGPRQSGSGEIKMGERFNKKLKVMETGRKRRK